MDVNDDKNEAVPCSLFCGKLAEEWHHIAGRVNEPDFTIPLCKKCHLMLTRLMRAAGVDLTSKEKPFAVKLEAILIGVGLFLVALAAALVKEVVAQWIPA